MRAGPAALAITLAFVASCATDRTDPIAPGFSEGSGFSASAWGPETPPFNDEIILRDVTGNGG